MENSSLINEAETFITRVIDGTYENTIRNKLKEIFDVDDVVFEGGKPQTCMYLIRGNNCYQLLIYCPSQIPRVYYNYEIFYKFEGVIQKERATIEKLVRLHIKIHEIKKRILKFVK